MSLTVTVVVCTHDRPGPLRRAAEAVLAQTRLPAEMIVVKDSPGPPAAELAALASAAGVPYRAVNMPSPSLPASRNRGMELAGGDVVMLLDDDMLMPPDFLADLLALYEADDEGRVAGIGVTPALTTPPGMGQRIWDSVSAALGRGRWVPRRWAARSVALPWRLRGKLLPARRLSGGTISLRRRVAKSERFEQAFTGYALAEDREFCYRVGARHGLFFCPSLVLTHDFAPGGRPDTQALGRMYVVHSFHVAALSIGGGAGTYLVMGCELAGMFALHAAYLLPGDTRAHWGFMAGMSAGLMGLLARSVRRSLCGS
jgi:glycosyltransferase involved in cell wall biosynthesis